MDLETRAGDLLDRLQDCGCAGRAVCVQLLPTVQGSPCLLLLLCATASRSANIAHHTLAAAAWAVA